MGDQNMNPNDHDLLIEINVLVKQIQQAADRDRADAAVRDRVNSDRLKLVENDVSDLKTSKAQFLAITAAIAFAISLLVRFFWR